MEDRSLSRNNRRFVDEMNKILDNEKSNIGAENFTIAKVPGRMDFNIRFEPNEDASSSKNSVPFYKTLRGCLGTHFRNSLKIGRLDKINPLF